MKAIINSVTPKVWHDSVKNEDKKFQEIIFDGNKTGSAWKDDFSNFVGKEIEIEVKLTAKGKNSLSLGVASVPTSSAPPAIVPNNNIGTAVSDHFDFDVRKTSLLIALEKFEKTNKTIEGEGFWPEVKVIETFLRDGTVPDKK